MKPLTVVQLPLFRHNVLVAVGKKGFKMINEAFESEIISKKRLDDAPADALTEYAGAGTVCIYLRKPRHGDLAHEAVHAANMIFQVIGHETHASNDEVLAYTVGYIIDEVMTPYAEEDEK